MNDHSPENPGHEHRHTAQGVSRRRLLAAGGVLVAGGLAGCSAVDGVVDRAASEAIGTKAASPGGLYTGDVQISTSPLYESSAIDVRNVPPTVTAAGQRIELEGWATTSRLDAQNHNASRSNRTSPVQSDDPDHIGAYNFTIEIEGAWAGDTDGDGPTDAVVLAEILDMTEACWVYAEACRAAATEEDAGAVERYAGGFGDVCRQLRRALERCSDDRCRALAESNERRLSSVPRAVEAAEAGEWDRVCPCAGNWRHHVTAMPMGWVMTSTATTTGCSMRPRNSTGTSMGTPRSVRISWYPCRIRRSGTVGRRSTRN